LALYKINSLAYLIRIDYTSRIVGSAPQRRADETAAAAAATVEAIGADV